MNPDELRAQLEALAASFMEIRKQKIADGVLTPNPNNSSIFAKAQTNLRSIFDKFIGELLPRIKEATKNAAISFSDADASLLRQTMAQINVYQEALKSASPAEVAAAVSLTKSIASFQSNYASYLAIVSKGNPTCTKNLIQLSSLSAWVKGKLETMLAGALALPQAQDKLATLMDVLQTGAASGVVDGVLVYATFKKKLATTAADLQTYQQQFDTDKLQFPKGSAALNSDAILQLLDKGLPNRQGGTQAATDAPDVAGVLRIDVKVDFIFQEVRLIDTKANSTVQFWTYPTGSTPGISIEVDKTKLTHTTEYYIKVYDITPFTKAKQTAQSKVFKIAKGQSLAIRCMGAAALTEETSLDAKKHQLHLAIQNWREQLTNAIDQEITRYQTLVTGILSIIKKTEISYWDDAVYKAMTFMTAKLAGKAAQHTMAALSMFHKAGSLIKLMSSSTPISLAIACAFDVAIGKFADNYQIPQKRALEKHSDAAFSAAMESVGATFKDMRKNANKNISDLESAFITDIINVKTATELDSLIAIFDSSASTSVQDYLPSAAEVEEQFWAAVGNPLNLFNNQTKPAPRPDENGADSLPKGDILTFLQKWLDSIGIDGKALVTKQGSEAETALRKAYDSLKEHGVSPYIKSIDFTNILADKTWTIKNKKLFKKFRTFKKLFDDKVVDINIEALCEGNLEHWEQFTAMTVGIKITKIGFKSVQVTDIVQLDYNQLAVSQAEITISYKGNSKKGIYEEKTKEK